MLPCAGISMPLPLPDTEASSSAVTPDPNCNTGPTPDAGPLNTLQLVPGFYLTIEQADEYLNIYRTRMVPHFPFLPIDPSVTATQLHKEKRFLFWCIMQALAPQTAPVQKSVDDWIRQHAAMHIIVNRERKLELLQGLLLYIACFAWGDIHIHLGMSANGLLQLAIGMVMDMSINTLAGPLAWMPKTMVSDAWSMITRGKQMETPKQTLEEQRAILGGYFLASSVAISMRRSPQIQWSAHIARCCKNIREARELETDQNLVALVRMQHVADRIRTTFPIYDRDEDDPAPEFKEHYTMVLASLRKEIDVMVAEEPAITKEKPIIWCHYMTLLVRIYEPAIGMRGIDPTGMPSAAQPYSRTAALWTCLGCIQDAIEALVSIPAESYAYLPFTMVSSTAFVMMSANRLLLEDREPDWDVVVSRQKLDHAENTRRIAEKFEEADNVALIVGQKRRLFEDNTSRWANYAYRARWMRQWYLSKTSPATREPSAEQPSTTTEGMMPDTTIASNWMDDFSLDKSLWGQMLVDFDFGINPIGMNWLNDGMVMSNIIPQ
ncbi:C6 transcription factor [Colletotrichum karsti]|uniref:C6 transcription factor n=1 Tax=Colletotrichum karsti TaxID=1095194 RepID=A0A9P6I037_9PEZI|nr:C6 transcription factor [Colletotrichum karsti]KAF9872396.1 C6 transcription factor [Colletotrichum karsti]